MPSPLSGGNVFTTLLFTNAAAFPKFETGNGVGAFGTELVLTANISEANVLSLKNIHASGYSALTFRDKDNNEMGSLGYDNPSASVYPDVLLLSVSDASSGHSGIAPRFVLNQASNYTGSGLVANNPRMSLEVLGNINFYPIDGSPDQAGRPYVVFDNNTQNFKFGYAGEISLVIQEGTGVSTITAGHFVGDGSGLTGVSATGALVLKGSTDCSGNPNYPSAVKGDTYIVSVAGKIGGASGKVVEVGDLFIASADNAGGTQAGVGSSWVIQQTNIDLANIAITGGTINGAAIGGTTPAAVAATTLSASGAITGKSLISIARPFDANYGFNFHVDDTPLLTIKGYLAGPGSEYGESLTLHPSDYFALSSGLQLRIGGTVTIGGGTAIAKVLSAAATLNFGSILAAASADLTITVTGAAVGDAVDLGCPTAPDTSIVYNAFVSAADTVTVRAFNVGAIADDPASATYRVAVFHF